MRRSLRIRRAGVSVKVHWSLVLLVTAISVVLAIYVMPWPAAIVAALASLGSVLAHELAHARLARRWKLPVRGVTLSVLGGITELDAEPSSPRAAFQVAAVGPAVSAVIVLGCVGIVGVFSGVAGGTVAVAAAWLALFNGALLAANLLPGMPLDGGRMLQALVWRGTGNRLRAERVAAVTGVGVGAALVVVGVVDALVAVRLRGLGAVLFGVFLGRAALGEWKAAQIKAAAVGVRVGDVMTRRVAVASADAGVAEMRRAVGVAAAPVVVLVDRARRPVGVVPTAWLGRRGPVPLPAAIVVAEDHPLLPLLYRNAVADVVTAVVVADAGVVGVVTVDVLPTLGGPRRDPISAP